MKRSLLSLLMVAFFVSGPSACAEKPATHFGPTSEAPNLDIAVQTDETAKPADVPMTNVATVAAGKIKPADSLKLILLQLLVAR